MADRDGFCPRCGSKDVEREVLRYTSEQLVSGVLFSCRTCGLEARAVSADREAWFFAHKSWASPHVPEKTLDEFERRWSKKVMRPNYGPAEPLGPVLPDVK